MLHVSHNLARAACRAAALTRCMMCTSQLTYFNNSLNFILSSVIAWTDSTIVLAWIQRNPHLFKVYVGNRTSQIMALVPASSWGHVVNEDNSTDCAL